MNPCIINSPIITFHRQFQPMFVLQIPLNYSNVFDSKGTKKITGYTQFSITEIIEL